MLVSDHWNFTDISFILQFVLYTYWNPLCHNITNLASKGFSLLWVHFWSKQIEIFSLHILWNPLYPIIYNCTIIFFYWYKVFMSWTSVFPSIISVHAQSFQLWTCLYWCFLPLMLISSMCNYVLWCTYIVKFTINIG